jgi:putative ATP-dependent endonuclease of OLD family
VRRYAATQLLQYWPPNETFTAAHVASIPAWDNAPRMFDTPSPGQEWLTFLEGQGVFFSSPLDLDFAMLTAFPDGYGAAPLGERTSPEEVTVKSVLGKSHGDSTQYTADQQKLFATYHSLFKIGSKPAEHLEAMIKLSDEDFRAAVPSSLVRLIAMVQAKLVGLPE